MSTSNSLVSQIVLGLVLSFIGIGVGFQLASLTDTSKSSPSPSPQEREEGQEEGQDDLDDDDLDDDDLDDDGIPDGDLAAVSAGFLEPCKMVLVVRTDLKLFPGSIAAQCCQATLACYKVLSKKNPSLVSHWEYTGQAKIALKAKSEDQLLELEAMAKSLNLCARSVTDPDKGDVRSVLAIGPAPVALINEVTGKLRLL